MKRYHQELNLIKHNHRLHWKWMHDYTSTGEIGYRCKCGLTPGHFRKRKPIGCPSHHRACRRERYAGPHIKDRIFKIRYQDALTERDTND